MKTTRIIISAALMVSTSFGEWINQVNVGLGHGPQVGPSYDVQSNSIFDINYTFYKVNFGKSKRWEFRGGAGYSYLWTNVDVNSEVHVLSVFPTLRWYFKETTYFKPYLNATAGPSIMSDNSLGYQEQGSRFLFNDFFGVGAYVGRDKLWEISWSWRHLSNALLFPPNPGFDVPFTFSVGRVF
jgi:hypothetical protein